MVPSKGSTGSHAARMVIELINECGDNDQDVILKTDQEAAIKFLDDDVCVNRTGACTINTEGQQGAERHCRAGGAVSGTVPQDIEVIAG